MTKQIHIPETTDEIKGPLDAINYVLWRTSRRETEINKMQTDAPLYTQNSEHFHNARRATMQCRKAALFVGRVVAETLRKNPYIQDGNLAAAIMDAAEDSPDLAAMDMNVMLWVGRLAGVLHTRKYETLGNMQIGSLSGREPIKVDENPIHIVTVEVFDDPTTSNK